MQAPKEVHIATTTLIMDVDHKKVKNKHLVIQISFEKTVYVENLSGKPISMTVFSASWFGIGLETLRELSLYFYVPIFLEKMV